MFPENAVGLMGVCAVSKCFLDALVLVFLALRNVSKFPKYLVCVGIGARLEDSRTAYVATDGQDLRQQ